MADDERRAEIEAVARVLIGAQRPAETDPDIPDPDKFASWRAACREAERAIAEVNRVRDARGDDEAGRGIEEHDGLPGYWVCERCGQPLNAEGRCNSGLHVGPGEDANGMAIHTTDLAALSARSPQGEDPLYPDGPTASEAAAIMDRWAQGEDHEAGLEEATRTIFGTPTMSAQRQLVGEAIAAYLSRVSPSRDGTVAVEDVARAMHRVDFNSGRARYDWDEMQEGYREDCRRHARAALAEFSPASTGDRPLSE